MTRREFPQRAVRRADVGPTQATVFITCAACGGTEDLIMPKHSALPPEIQIRKFTEKGWEVGSSARLDFCPACQPKRNKLMARRPKPEPTDDAVRAIAALQTPTVPTGRQLAELFMALDDSYDSEVRDYKAGCSDELVAAQVNMPLEVVVEQRSKHFGPITDRRAIQLNDAAQTLAGELEQLHQQLAAVQANVADLLVRAAAIADRTSELAGG